MVKHEDIIPIIPKPEFPKPVNMLLKGNFHKALLTTPEEIEQVELYVKSLCPSNSDSLMVLVNYTQGRKRKKYLYYLDSY